MEIGWICETPYHILNCLAYVLNHSDKEDKFDLYIVHQFVNLEKLEENIRKSGIFRHVISFRPSGNKKGIYRKIEKCFRVLLPRRWLYKNQDVRMGDCDIPKQYDVLFLAIWNIWSVALYFSVGVKEIKMFEDGTGAYYSNMSDFQPRAKFIHRLLGRDTDNFKPQGIYLNNPCLCQRKTKCTIYPFHGLTESNLAVRKKIYQIFDYKQDGYYAGYHIIYLTQPNDYNIPNMEETDNKILSLLEKYNEDVLLRPHPRQKNFFREDVSVDNHQDMWELVCADQITDNHVLVSIFSTAQITPKLLYNKEPYLILLYNLYPGLLPQKRGEILGLIERIRNVYSRPEKVFLPNTLEELRECIDQIVEDRCQNE